MTQTSYINKAFAQRRTQNAIQIGDWELYPDTGVLRRDQHEARLNAKTLHVLLVLLEHVGEGVSRDTLLNEVWGANYPTDSVVSRAIADMRAALGEKAGEQRYIRTLPKYGYQLVADVSALVISPSGLANSKTHPSKPASKRLSQYLLISTSLLIIAVAFWYLLPLPSAPINNGTLSDLPLPQPLTSSPGIEQQARISKDGTWVIYTALRQGSNDWDLFRVFTDDTNSQPIAVTSDINEHGPAISPLDNEIAYVRQDQTSCQVVVQTVGIGIPETLAACTKRFPTLVDWSPDGNWLAFTADEADEPEQRRRLYQVNRFNGDLKQISTAVSATGSDYYPRYSPSGQQLAFIRGEPQPDHRSTLWLVSLSDGTEQALIARPGQFGGLTWIDDTHILYSITDAGQYHLWQLNLSNGKRQRMNIPNMLHPDINLDSTIAVGTLRRNERDLLMYQPDGETHHIASSTSDDYSGVLSPDEQWLAFISQRSGYDELWLADVTGTAVRRLTRFAGSIIRYPDWHPDGRRLLFTAQSGQRERLYQVDIISGEVTRLGPSDIEVTTPRWMPDGKHWVFGCQFSNTWGLCLGNQTEIQPLVTNLFRPEPLSNDVVYAVDQNGALQHYFIHSRTQEEVWANLPSNGRFGWTISESKLYYLAPSDLPSTGQLRQYDLESNIDELLYQGEFSLADTILRKSLLSGNIMLGQFESASDDIVIFHGVSLTQ